MRKHGEFVRVRGRKRTLYQIRLTDGEMKALAFGADRGYFPAEVYDALSTAEESETVTERWWVLEEHEAWPLLEARDEEGFLTCMAPGLCDKIMALIDVIV